MVHARLLDAASQTLVARSCVAKAACEVHHTIAPEPALVWAPRARRVNVLLGQRPDLLDAIAQAKTVALSAYVLPAENAVVRALAVAADRGARVVVTLDGSPYFGKAGNGAPNPNANCAAVLRAHGATVRLSDAADPAVHLKAAVVDGRAFLDDRNWPASGHETVVETDDPAAVDAIAAAIDGHANSQPGLALQKAAALALEAATIRMAGGDHIDVATESFGTSIVSVALCERARAGAAVRLAVNARVLAGDVHGRERAALARLRACGVAIEAVTTAEKFAIVGDVAWLGSANATASEGDMLDWGVRSDDARLAGTLETAFACAWSRGVPVAPPHAPKRAAAVADVRAVNSPTPSPSSSATNAAVAAM